MSESPIDPFANPSDLWVLPPPRVSAWFSRVDWYLNWQMSKGVAYAGLHLPNETLRLSEEYETPLPPVTPADSTAPLLVLAMGRLPTRKCVVVEGKTFGGTWLEKVHGIAQELDAKTVHIFLPAKMSVAEAQKAWSGRFASRAAQFSADAEAF